MPITPKTGSLFHAETHKMAATRGAADVHSSWSRTLFHAADYAARQGACQIRREMLTRECPEHRDQSQKVLFAVELTPAFTR